MVDIDACTVGDFLEASESATVPSGVYRVVGTPAGALVCLRVTDESGHRTHTGDLVRVDADDASALEPASEPRTTPVALLKNVFQGPYWIIRSLLPF